MQGDNHTDVVADAKRFCEAYRIALAGACGAFEITRRVAWRLRDEGIGLLDKPGGEQCRGFAAGFVVYRDGTGIDILGDAGGENIPQWSLDNGPDAGMAARWRQPIDPGDGVPGPGPGPRPVPDPPVDPDAPWLEDLLKSLDRITDGLHGVRDAIDSLASEVQSIEEHGVKMKFR